MVKALCLHGMRQNAELVSPQFTELLTAVEVAFLEAPHTPKTPLSEALQPFRSIFGDYDKGTSHIWWDTLDDGTYDGVDASFDALLAEIRATKPTALAGFSQGGAMTLVYLLECALRGIEPTVTHAICVAPPHPLRHPPLLEKLQKKTFLPSGGGGGGGKEENTIIPRSKVKVLFLFGTNDPWCPYKEAALKEFMDPSFESWSVAFYDGEHIVPTDPASKDAVKTLLAA